jgi:hypothetical protein
MSNSLGSCSSSSAEASVNSIDKWAKAVSGISGEQDRGCSGGEVFVGDVEGGVEDV